MIVVGGQAPKAIRSVECYDFEEERWDQVAELPSRRCRAGKGNFYCNILCFPDAPLQHWMHVLSPPFSFLCAPDLKQLFLFAIPSSFFSTDIFPFLFRWMVLLSSGVAPACQPSIAAVSPSSSLFPGCSSISVSPPPPPLLSWQPTGIQFFLLVKIKGAESVPLGAEEWVMESRSLSWEYSSENI